MITAGLLLAAGASQRFGRADKLMSRWRGATMVEHSAQCMIAAGVTPMIATVSAEGPAQVLAQMGVRLVWVPHGASQSESLIAGVQHASTLGAKALLIGLGDMPFLSVPDLMQILQAPAPAIACRDGQIMPPAFVPQHMFARLLQAKGDRGAGPILREMPGLSQISLPATHLRDIDYPEDLP